MLRQAGVDTQCRSGGPLWQQAYVEIKRRIQENELAPGAQLLEIEFAELLHMSRTPVREALIRLSKEGFVEIRPRHGIRILPISIEDMREIYDILTALESEAASILAERGLNDYERIELERSLDDMDRSIADNDVEAWAVADMTFHKHLVRFAGSKRLRYIVKTLSEQAYRTRLATLKLRGIRSGSNDDHRALVDAICRRDAAEAHRLHREHWRKSCAKITAVLQDNFAGYL